MIYRVLPQFSDKNKKTTYHILYPDIYILKLESRYGQTINFNIYHFLTVNIFFYIYMNKYYRNEIKNHCDKI